jgi:hypothetical protein
MTSTLRPPAAPYTLREAVRVSLKINYSPHLTVYCGVVAARHAVPGEVFAG